MPMCLSLQSLGAVCAQTEQLQSGTLHPRELICPLGSSVHNHLLFIAPGSSRCTGWILRRTDFKSRKFEGWELFGIYEDAGFPILLF